MSFADLSMSRHLETHNSAAEEPNQHYDRKTADPDDVHLKKQIVRIERSANDILNGATRQTEIILKRQDGRFDEIEQAGGGLTTMLA